MTRIVITKWCKQVIITSYLSCNLIILKWKILGDIDIHRYIIYYILIHHTQQAKKN